MILAIDTAANLCAACVWRDGAVLGRSVLDIGKGHAERLMEVMEAALRAAAIGYGDLDRVVVSVGPGSFTGVRVGVAAARGLALALDIPAAGVTTLGALAAEARAGLGALPVLAVLDAKRDELYAALYGPAGETLAAPAALSLEDACALADGSTALAGTAARMVAARLGGDFAVGPETATADIRFFAELADASPSAGSPKPLYLRAPDTRPQAGFAVERAG